MNIKTMAAAGSDTCSNNHLPVTSGSLKVCVCVCMCVVLCVCVRVCMCVVRVYAM